MSISTAIQKDSNNVYLYDQNDRLVIALSGTLLGYTSSTVSIKVGNSIYVYDEKGRLKFVR